MQIEDKLVKIRFLLNRSYILYRYIIYTETMTGTKKSESTNESASSSVMAQLAVDDFQISRLKSTLNEQVDGKQPAVNLEYHHYHKRKDLNLSTTATAAATTHQKTHHRAKSFTLLRTTSTSSQSNQSPAILDHHKINVLLLLLLVLTN